MSVTDCLSCSECGYALRGIDVRGRCPECGQRIRRSAAAKRLAERPQFWSGDAALIAMGGGYMLLNFIIVAVMMKLDPYAIFDVWPWFVYVAPAVAIVAGIFVCITVRRFHWLTLAAFILGMPVIGWLNLQFVMACSAAV